MFNWKNNKYNKNSKAELGPLLIDCHQNRIYKDGTSQYSIWLSVPGSDSKEIITVTKIRGTLADAQAEAEKIFGTRGTQTNSGFLDIRVGDTVVVYDEYSHDHIEHRIKVESIEFEDEFINGEYNPKGMRCYGTDLDEEEWGDDYMTVVTETNFCRIVKRTVYTVSTQSKIDYDFSVETVKHGAFRSFDEALEKLKEVVEEFKKEHQKDFEMYSDEEEYPDEEAGALFINEDYETGHWGCCFGFQDDFEEHTICIDEWEVEE